MTKEKPRWFKNTSAMLYGMMAIFALTTFVCLQPAWQPRGYRTSPVVCPPRETDTRGYCFVHRNDDYIYHETSPEVIHISRGSGPGGNDVITTAFFSRGRLKIVSSPTVDPYPPQNHVDAFVQAVRDRRTELYSEMGWPDPNPHPMTPLNR